jgi:hypothetical protein
MKLVSYVSRKRITICEYQMKQNLQSIHTLLSVMNEHENIPNPLFSL